MQREIVIVEGEEREVITNAAGDVVSSRLYRPEPAARRPLSRLAFLSLFTAAERKAIRQAGKSNADVEDWLELFNAAQEVDVTYPATIAGVQALEAEDILAKGRAAQILGG